MIRRLLLIRRKYKQSEMKCKRKVEIFYLYAVNSSMFDVRLQGGGGIADMATQGQPFTSVGLSQW
jgi:hypothetical protein